MVRFPAEWRQTIRNEGAGMPVAFVYMPGMHLLETNFQFITREFPVCIRV